MASVRFERFVQTVIFIVAAQGCSDPREVPVVAVPRPSAPMRRSNLNRALAKTP
uniref:Uncharacterized protein n=1 Tax=Anguilla anguilla TaxID=7936 RepID=A0A0E9RMJ5_ANGAN